MQKITTSMIRKAREALPNAYAPYSNFKVGACLCSEDETLFTGVNMENGAYGLTVCAETAALCQMVSSGKRIVKSIVILSDNNIPCPPCGACRQRIYEFSTPDTRIYLCNEDTILQSLTINELLPNAFCLTKKL